MARNLPKSEVDQGPPYKYDHVFLLPHRGVAPLKVPQSTRYLFHFHHAGILEGFSPRRDVEYYVAERDTSGVGTPSGWASALGVASELDGRRCRS
jgi:hypothetical protein